MSGDREKTSVLGVVGHTFRSLHTKTSTLSLATIRHRSKLPSAGILGVRVPVPSTGCVMNNAHGDNDGPIRGVNKIQGSNKTSTDVCCTYRM